MNKYINKIIKIDILILMFVLYIAYIYLNGIDFKLNLLSTIIKPLKLLTSSSPASK